MKRKIIQLLTNDTHSLIALCNDGTVLREDSNQWALNNWDVPQPDNKKTKSTKEEFDFSKWPNSADPKIFNELCRSRKSKRSVIMTQAYIDSATKHLHDLNSKGVDVNKALSIAAKHGWQGFKASWVLNEIQSEPERSEEQPQTVQDVVNFLNDGRLKNIADIPTNLRKEVETLYRVGRFNPETCKKLELIGLAI